MAQQLTYKFRLRDKHTAALREQARAVNFVWNYCNETQRKAAKEGRKWLSQFDFDTKGTSKELGIPQATINAVPKQYVASRQQHKKPWLRFRGKKTLGWIPVRGIRQISSSEFKAGSLVLSVFKPRPAPVGAKICDSSINEDSQGHWHLNVVLKVEDKAAAHPAPGTAVGIDLGLKTLVALSDGTKVEPMKPYRASEQRLARAQRANKKKLTRAIHTKIKNQRKDTLHKLSLELARTHETIFVGDVSSSALAKTNMAKSILDAGWSALRSMLSYKSVREGGRTIVMPEKFSTQICSSCGDKPSSRPRGIAGLGMRGWTCSSCGADHDRDVNAALNILRFGQEALAEGAAGSGADTALSGLFTDAQPNLKL